MTRSTIACSPLNVSWSRLNHGSTRRFASRRLNAALDEGLLTIKAQIRELSAKADRGRTASLDLRSEIEEAQVALEAMSTMSIDFEKLKGRWRLIYTDTADVLPVLFLGQPPLLDNLPWPINIGAIYQDFSLPEDGVIKNIIKAGFDNLLEEEGISLTVYTRYTVGGPKRLMLTFERAEFGDVKISPLVESILAPAILPRSGFNHQLLLAIREFSLSVPLGPQRVALNSQGLSTAGYLLTYLDDDMLIGRPLDVGGTFIFNKEEGYPQMSKTTQ